MKSKSQTKAGPSEEQPSFSRDYESQKTLDRSSLSYERAHMPNPDYYNQKTINYNGRRKKTFPWQKEF